MKNNMKLLIGLVVLFATALLGLLLYLYTQFQPVDPTTQTTKRFVIAKGSGAQVIANNLVREELIKNHYIFRLYVKLIGIENKMQAGSYELSPGMSVQEISQTLTEGTQDTWITLLEGWRAEEIAEYLDEQDLNFFDKGEFIALATADEGKLYPDTYLVPKDITAKAMYQLLRNTFENKVTQGLTEEIARSEREFDDVLIIASLVEREARDYQQMRHVAGILWNRVDIGMALQVDATLQYAKGFNATTNSWWAPPLAADKSVNSPYNTYTNPGLPPTPIANPSQQAVKAALDPLEVNDLFYLHTSDGNMYFAEDLEGHNANVNKYLR